MTSEVNVKQVRRRSWLKHWPVMTLVATVGVGVFSGLALFRSPALPNCPSIFWPLASASLRLYCAQLAANKQTGKDLLEAMALVRDLPKDHALRPEINRYLEQWSQDLLDVAEGTFQQGGLLDALDVVSQIPENTVMKAEAQHDVKRWQKVWSAATKTYQEAEAELREGEWRLAFRIASELTFVGNEYWEITKFEALNQAVRRTREELTLFSEAQDLLEDQGLENLRLALSKLQKIPSGSYLVGKVRKTTLEVGTAMLALAEKSLERKELQETLDIAQQIPDAGNLRQKAQDLIFLAQAQARAESSSSLDLKAAIELAKNLTPNRPLYPKAQAFIQQWQAELDAVPIYEQAQQLAALGQIQNLKAAVAQAERIPASNPLWKKVEKSVNGWKRDIFVLEDQPVLDQALQLASVGDMASLKDAIQTAKQIQSGRPLYSEAQQRVQDWSRQVQQTEDQPILDQARDLANQGNLTAAIQVAQQIRPGRVLSDEAQSSVRAWQADLSGQQLLATARQQAESGTLEGLTAAIGSATQVTSSSSARGESIDLINQWSERILQFAEETAQVDLNRAIAVAQTIPSRASLYDVAQQRIQAWQEQLNPPPPPEPIPVEPPPPAVDSFPPEPTLTEPAQ
jgi:hypothetical protein